MSGGGPLTFSNKLTASPPPSSKFSVVGHEWIRGHDTVSRNNRSFFVRSSISQLIGGNRCHGSEKERDRWIDRERETYVVFVFVRAGFGLDPFD